METQEDWELLCELEAAHARGELEAIERIAHRMRGAAKTVGAQRVALSCQHLQNAFNAPDEGRSTQALQQLARELKALFPLLASRLEALDGKH